MVPKKLWRKLPSVLFRWVLLSGALSSGPTGGGFGVLAPSSRLCRELPPGGPCWMLLPSGLCRMFPPVGFWNWELPKGFCSGTPPRGFCSGVPPGGFCDLVPPRTLCDWPWSVLPALEALPEPPSSMLIAELPRKDIRKSSSCTWKQIHKAWNTDV